MVFNFTFPVIAHYAWLVNNDPSINTLIMARIFTTRFTYQRKIYIAVISQAGDYVKVYVPDESLHHILPDGKITFNFTSGPLNEITDSRPLQEILDCIFNTIDVNTRFEQRK